MKWKKNKLNEKKIIIKFIEDYLKTLDLRLTIVLQLSQILIFFSGFLRLG